MARGWECWECGTRWTLAVPGVAVKSQDGHDPECRHPEDLHFWEEDEVAA